MEIFSIAIYIFFGVISNLYSQSFKDAVCSGDLEKVKIFVEKIGVDVNLPFDNGYSPLEEALNAHDNKQPFNMSVLSYLLYNPKINLKYQDKNGMSPIAFFLLKA